MLARPDNPPPDPDRRRGRCHGRCRRNRDDKCLAKAMRKGVVQARPGCSMSFASRYDPLHPPRARHANIDIRSVAGFQRFIKAMVWERVS